MHPDDNEGMELLSQIVAKSLGGIGIFEEEIEDDKDKAL